MTEALSKSQEVVEPLIGNSPFGFEFKDIEDEMEKMRKFIKNFKSSEKGLSPENKKFLEGRKVEREKVLEILPETLYTEFEAMYHLIQNYEYRGLDRKMILNRLNKTNHIATAHVTKLILQKQPWGRRLCKALGFI